MRQGITVHTIEDATAITIPRTYSVCVELHDASMYIPAYIYDYRCQHALVHEYFHNLYNLHSYTKHMTAPTHLY